MIVYVVNKSEQPQAMDQGASEAAAKCTSFYIFYIRYCEPELSLEFHLNKIQAVKDSARLLIQ